MAKIRIEPGALEKMRNSGRTYIISLVRRGGWGGSIITPAVYAGSPAEESEYDKQEVEGVTVYTRKELADQSYVISWSGIWIFGSLVVFEE